MKKLLCLLILTTLIVGCTSKLSSENKEEHKTSETKDIEDKKQDEDIKEEEKVSTDDEIEDTSIAQDDKPKNDAPSTNTNTNTNTDTSVSNSNSNQSSSGNANGSSNSNNGGSTTPPKQETPTPPKVETPPPPKPPVPETPIEQRGKADAVMAQINSYRQQNGLAPFIVDSYLINSSSNHAYAMAEKRALWHSGTAECITNYDDPFSAWKNSPAHNDILLTNNRYGAVSIYYVDEYYFSVFQTSP